MRVSVLVGLALACGAAVRAQEPATILWRGEELARARAGLRAGDTALVLALRALGTEARAALRVPPQSVVQKEGTPPSEDKHDYMSFGPYWWPDRARPGGVPYIRRDGRRNPEAARDSDSPRQATMVHAVEALALGWYFTGDTAVARHAGVLLRAWYLDPATRMNPNLEYGQGVPGLVSGRGTGIIDTHILPGLLDAVRLLDGSGALLADEQQGLRDWMRQYLHWLESSRNGSEERRARNNHGSWYDVQVADLALFVGDTAAARAALERGKTRIAEILSDGREPLELARTRSLDYSAFNLDALTALAELGRRAGVDLWHYTAPNGGSIPAALRYLAPFADPRRPWPGEQITQPSPDFLLLPLARARLALGDDAYARAIASIPVRSTHAHIARLLYPSAFIGL